MSTLGSLGVYKGALKVREPYEWGAFANERRHMKKEPLQIRNLFTNGAFTNKGLFYE